MELTVTNKQYIDSLSYEQLLAIWRLSPIGNPWFEGATGEYWGKRMSFLRNQPGGEQEHIRASKLIGWR